MAQIFISWLKIISTVTFIVLISLYVYYRLITARYWSKRNVPHVKPKFLLGTLWKANIFENVHETLAKLYLENRDKKMIGIWSFHFPSVIVTDVALIKRILISDFNNFRDRGFEINADLDPLAGHLFLLKGKKWRNLRVKLTPAFSTGKMKMMFPTMLKCGEELRQYLKEPSQQKEVIEVKDLLARFTTDVIGSCAFGLETNTIHNPQSDFRKYGNKSVTLTAKNFVFLILSFLFPKVAKIFRIRLIPQDVSNFFLKVVDDTIKYREKTQTVRNDFLQLLIQLMRAGKIEDVDKTPIEVLDDEEIVQKFSLHEAAAQCFVFFSAGFETSSAALTFALYELALNPDIQTRLQHEIDTVSNNGEITYEKVSGLEYLDMVVHETLRKYPPIGNLQRSSINEYRIPELNATFDKGTIFGMSVTGIHRDPDFYPEPDKFDPERFSPEEKKTRDPCTFLPFGDGPRNCIGNRFAVMQIKVGLISVLRDYNVEVTQTTPIPISYVANTVALSPKGGMNLSFAKR